MNHWCPDNGRTGVAISLLQLEEWFRHELPRLNRAVLSDGAPPSTVADGAAAVFPLMPAPTAISTREAQRLVIGLGLAGSSIARHHQETDPVRKQHPERSFDGLLAGPDRMAFTDYFTAVAERTGTGHYGRDAYASLVLWNVPTLRVRYQGRVLASLPGVNDDGHILSYTGDPGETWFFELVKRGQTIELAANDLLAPLAEGELDLTSAEGLRRVRLATTLLEALRLLFLEFANATPGEGMAPTYFMDVFRQFAVHWHTGDIPPSGALDVDALKRDFLLGTADEPYRRHIERIMPALLTRERAELAAIMQHPPLPVRLLDQLGLDPASFAQLDDTQLTALAGSHPAVTEWYLLLSAHARAAGGHLMLSKRFLFNPQRHRDETGIGDKPLVSNRKGTTGMDEPILDRLTRMRREHVLAGLRRTPVATARTDLEFSVDDVDVVSSAGLTTLPGPSSTAVRPRVRAAKGDRSRFGEQVIGE
jgi:hypothetical protein